VARDSEGNLYVPCDEGRHLLIGQLAEDGDHLVGLWPVK
jgi:hypothetical protein